MGRDTPLHDAARKGDISQVEALIKRGADVHLTGYRQFTPLHYAAKFNHEEIVDLLLAKGANPTAAALKSENSFSATKLPAHLASKPSIVEKLNAASAEYEEKIFGGSSLRQPFPLNRARSATVMSGGSRYRSQLGLNSGSMKPVRRRSLVDMIPKASVKPVSNLTLEMTRPPKLLFTATMGGSADKAEEQQLRTRSDTFLGGSPERSLSGLVHASDRDNLLRQAYSNVGGTLRGPRMTIAPARKLSKAATPERSRSMSVTDSDLSMSAGGTDGGKEGEYSHIPTWLKEMLAESRLDASFADNSLPSRLVDYVIGFRSNASIKKKSSVAADFVEQSMIYPKQPHEDFACPPGEMLSIFCFPEGFADAVVANEAPVEFHSFALTDEAGSMCYGYCLTYFEHKEKGEDMLWPACLCLLTHWPFHSLFREVLSRLYMLSRCTLPRPMESYVSCFVHSAPIPPRGEYMLNVHVDEDSEVRYERPAVDELPLVDAPVEDLLDYLSPVVLATAVVAVALECNIVVVSRRRGLLLPICEALRALALPIRTVHTYIPLLPASLSGVLLAPTPYFVGVERAVWTNIDDDLTEMNIYVLDVDDGSLTNDRYVLRENGLPSIFPTLPALPKTRFNALLERLNEIHDSGNSGVAASLLSGAAEANERRMHRQNARRLHEDMALEWNRLMSFTLQGVVDPADVTEKKLRRSSAASSIPTSTSSTPSNRPLSTPRGGGSGEQEKENLSSTFMVARLLSSAGFFLDPSAPDAEYQLTSFCCGCTVSLDSLSQSAPAAEVVLAEEREEEMDIAGESGQNMDGGGSRSGTPAGRGRSSSYDSSSLPSQVERRSTLDSAPRSSAHASASAQMERGESEAASEKEEKQGVFVLPRVIHTDPWLLHQQRHPTCPYVLRSCPLPILYSKEEVRREQQRYFNCLRLDLASLQVRMAFVDFFAEIFNKLERCVRSAPPAGSAPASSAASSSSTAAGGSSPSVQHRRTPSVGSDHSSDHMSMYGQEVTMDVDGFIKLQGRSSRAFFRQLFDTQAMKNFIDDYLTHASGGSSGGGGEGQSSAGTGGSGSGGGASLLWFKQYMLKKSSNGLFSPFKRRVASQKIDAVVKERRRVIECETSQARAKRMGSAEASSGVDLLGGSSSPVRDQSHRIRAYHSFPTLSSSKLHAEAHERSLQDSLARLLLHRVEVDSDRVNTSTGLNVNAFFRKLLTNKHEDGSEEQV